MSNTSLKDVYSALSAAVLADSDISAFIASTYGQSASLGINIGIDLENLPETTEAAAIYIIPGSRSRTRGDAYRQHNITVVSFVHCTETDENNGVTTLEAIGLLDDFTNLVEKCVFNKLREMRLAVTPLSGDSDSFYYPIARSELSYSIEIPSLI